ncbi:hypothetical protein GCM10020295_37000 [Streptomyces cinereospinus]
MPYEDVTDALPVVGDARDARRQVSDEDAPAWCRFHFDMDALHRVTDDPLPFAALLVHPCLLMRQRRLPGKEVAFAVEEEGQRSGQLVIDVHGLGGEQVREFPARYSKCPVRTDDASLVALQNFTQRIRATVLWLQHRGECVSPFVPGDTGLPLAHQVAEHKRVKRAGG